MSLGGAKMGPKFFQTLMGRKFFDVTVPKVVFQIERLNNNLEKLISLIEEKESKEDVKDEQDT
tara:strand:+ start:748 stop:936 length:189 start_codon:yes stop_codon:yes gene_type:complete